MAEPIILVTGASRRVGAAAATLAAQRGYAVCVSDREKEAAAASVVDTIVRAGGRAVAIQADVAVEPDIVRLFETCHGELGRLQALVDNTGILRNADARGGHGCRPPGARLRRQRHGVLHLRA